MWSNPQETADLLTFTEEIPNGKLHFFVLSILLRCSLPLDNCRGQTYDEASNIMGKHTGVSIQISAEQPKIIVMHC